MSQNLQLLDSVRLICILYDEVTTLCVAVYRRHSRRESSVPAVLFVTARKLAVPHYCCSSVNFRFVSSHSGNRARTVLSGPVTVSLSKTLCVIELVQKRLFLFVAAPVEDPEFTEQIENITVPAGRNVKLACSVKNLGTYKVRNPTRRLLYDVVQALTSLTLITYSLQNLKQAKCSTLMEVDRISLKKQNCFMAKE